MAENGKNADQKPHERLTKQRAREILEEIAVDPRNRSAQIQALRALESMWEQEEANQGAFSDLDGGDELNRPPSRRNVRVKGT
jgi:hypothetical protein